MIKGSGCHRRRCRYEGTLLFDGDCSAAGGLQDDENAGNETRGAHQRAQRAVTPAAQGPTDNSALLAEPSAFSSNTDEPMVTNSSLFELSAALARATA